MIQTYYHEATDYGNVYRIFTNPDIGGNIVDRPNQNDFDSFKRWLDEQLKFCYNDFYVYYEDEDFMGLAYTYDFKLHDSNCCLSVAVSSKYLGSGAGSAIAASALKSIFSNYPLRKVFFQIYEHNLRSISSIIDAGLKKEACLADYHYYKGYYEKMFIFSLTREDYCEILKG